MPLNIDISPQFTVRPDTSGRNYVDYYQEGMMNAYRKKDQDLNRTLINNRLMQSFQDELDWKEDQVAAGLYSKRLMDEPNTLPPVSKTQQGRIMMYDMFGARQKLEDLAESKRQSAQDMIDQREFNMRTRDFNAEQMQQVLNTVNPLTGRYTTETWSKIGEFRNLNAAARDKEPYLKTDIDPQRGVSATYLWNPRSGQFRYVDTSGLDVNEVRAARGDDGEVLGYYYGMGKGVKPDFIPVSRAEKLHEMRMAEIKYRHELSTRTKDRDSIEKRIAEIKENAYWKNQDSDAFQSSARARATIESLNKELKELELKLDAIRKGGVSGSSFDSGELKVISIE